MRVLKWTLVILAVLLSVELLMADCCSIPFIQPPGGQIPPTPQIPPLPPQIPQIPPPPIQGDLEGSSGGGVLDPHLLGSSDGVSFIDGARSLFAEPNQWGVIAWNGKEEILVLKTEEKSLIGKTAVLHFMPLPGKPIDVKKGDAKLYEKAYDLVQKKLPVDLPGRNVVVLERKIGAHNIFVWRIDNLSEFKAKIQAYAKKRFGGPAMALFTKETDRVIEDYFRRGFQYFAFDLCFDEGQNAEKTAIEYHFESKFAYYPMVVSGGMGKGHTRVELVVFTPPDGVNANVGKLTFADKDNRNGDIMTLGKKTVMVTHQELQQLSPGMAKLMGPGDVRARIWVMEGKLDQFPGDVMAFHKN